MEVEEGAPPALERRLSDPQTPTNYHDALKSALRDHCKAVGTRYKARDPAWTYTEAQGESEQFSVIADRTAWETAFDTRSNLLNLLEGLRKRRPLASVALRRVRGWGAERNESEGDAAGLAELRRRLDHLGDDITDCSARMSLEKEIFDLEHPKDEDWNDWSAWEEGGAA